MCQTASPQATPVAGLAVLGSEAEQLIWRLKKLTSIAISPGISFLETGPV
jgi:hypothetical protein